MANDFFFSCFQVDFFTASPVFHLAINLNPKYLFFPLLNQCSPLVRRISAMALIVSTLSHFLSAICMHFGSR